MPKHWLLGLLLAMPLAAQNPFISVNAPVVALTHVRVLDGTGGPALENQTIVLDQGKIAAVGAAVAVPEGAKVLDLTGDTVIPGLIGMHEHLFYPAGRGQYNEQSFSFPRLYLAAGVTTIRTGGNLEGYTDINLARLIDSGQRIGPHIFPTAPYMEGPTPFLQMHPLTSPAEAREFVRYWASVGANNYKGYMHITAAELGAAIQQAHELHLKVTAHLCSVGFTQAADLGIDDLEHGWLIDTEFVPGKKLDECPAQNETFATNAKLDMHGPQVQGLIHTLIAHHVAITSTLPVFETFVPNRPPMELRVLDVLSPTARAQYLAYRVGVAARASSSPMAELFSKEEEFERDFARQGGVLLAGLDPTGGGGVVAGFGDQRELELLVEAGFTPVQAVQIYTENAARYLGILNQVGTIATGKQADLVVIAGDPTARISDVEKVVTVFKQGVGYDSAKLIASVRDDVGIN